MEALECVPEMAKTQTQCDPSAPLRLLLLDNVTGAHAASSCCSPGLSLVHRECAAAKFKRTHASSRARALALSLSRTRAKGQQTYALPLAVCHYINIKCMHACTMATCPHAQAHTHANMPHAHAPHAHTHTRARARTCDGTWHMDMDMGATRCTMVQFCSELIACMCRVPGTPRKLRHASGSAPKPSGLALIHRHESSHICSIPNSARQPSSVAAYEGSAYTTDTSPGRRGAISYLMS